MTRSVVGNESDLGKARSVASICASIAWSTVRLGTSQVMRTTCTCTTRCVTVAAELGTILQ